MLTILRNKLLPRRVCLSNEESAHVMDELVNFEGRDPMAGLW